jgi:hypothetical protein
MKDIDVADAAFAGLGLVARQPLAALAWAVVYAAFIAVMVALFGGMVIGLIASVSRIGAKPDLSVVLSMIAGVFGAYIVFVVGMLIVGSIVTCAVIRAVLEPANSAFAYLRLGAQEFRMMLLALCQGLLIAVVAMILGAVMGILAFAVGSGSTSAIATSRIVSQLLVNGVTFWLYLRFSLAAPMTFDERRFRLFESWTLTRGHVWRLFLVGLVVVLICIGVYLAALVMGVAGGAAVWSAVPGLAHPKAFFARPPGEWLHGLAPLIALVSLLAIAVMAVVTPLAIAPWARAYRQLRPDDQIAAAFA